MLLVLIALVVGYIPCLILYFCLRKYLSRDAVLKKICKRTLLSGVICTFPIIILSGIFVFILKITGLETANPILYEALYNFIALALAEEIVKYLTFRYTIKKNQYPYSWIDVTALMVIVGIGFDLIETLVLAVTSGPVILLVRGVTIPHAGLGFIVGYFFGRSIKKNQPPLLWIGFIFAWLVHGLYDFSLSAVISDSFAIVAVALAVFNIVLVILLGVFIQRRKKNEEYKAPLFEVERKDML